jgi:hypothetical protein
MNQSAFRKTLFLVVPLIIAFALLLPAVRPAFGKGEFVPYWSSARLLLNRESPYDQAALKALESQTLPEVDFNQGQGLPVFNPPWLMLVLLPFGAVPFPLAARVWTAINISIVGFTALVLWKQFFNPKDSRGFALVLGFSFLFFETLNQFYLGQITGLVLISLIVALLCLRSGKDFLAGSLLPLAAIKPHLVYLVFALIFIWAIRHRRWKVFAGAAAAGLLSVAIITAILPGWLSSYFYFLNAFPFPRFVTTTLGGFFSIEFGIPIFRFAGILLLPLLRPLLKFVERGEWLTALNIALLSSIPLSFYGFSFDEILFIPAIAQLVFWAVKKEIPSRGSMAVFTGLLAIYTLRYALLFVYAIIPYHLLLWQPLAICMLYLYAWRVRELHAAAEVRRRAEPFPAKAFVP